jgi:hypothetical protein
MMAQKAEKQAKGTMCEVKLVTAMNVIREGGVGNDAYKRGQVVSLDAETAERLIARGYALAVGAVAEEPADTEAPTE